MLKLIIEDDEGRKTVVPFVRDEITIGRQEGNTIRLTERNVSRRHARLLRQNAHVLIEDLGSYNGIKVNGDRITGQVQVQDGDLIQIGDYDLAIQREEEARAAATVPLEPPRPQLAPTMKLPDPGATMPALPVVPEASEEDVQDAPAAGEEPPRHQSTAVIRVDQVAANRPQRSVVGISPSDAPRLVVLNTDFAGREFPCTKTELRIGRTDDNDIAIDHRSLSRTHCKVVREDSGEWKVIDLQSANGLMVNGESYAQVTLRLGDTLELGHVKMKFVGPGESVSLAAGAASSGAVTTEAPQGSSKGPVIAVVATLLVLIIGVGGYALFKSGGGSDPKPITPTVKDPDPQKNPSVVKPPEVNVEEILANAQVALDEGDLLKAESILRQCKIGESICPKAQKQIDQIGAERPVSRALDAAEQALDKGNTSEAQTQLAAAAGTKLLLARYQALDDRRSKMIQDELEKKKPPPEVRPVPPEVKKPDNKQTVADYYEQAKDLRTQKQYESAIAVLKACLKQFAKEPDCIAMLASVHATRGGEQANDRDNAEAMRLYKEFLGVAPPDHKLRRRVEELVRQHEK